MLDDDRRFRLSRMIGSIFQQSFAASSYGVTGGTQ
jgi:hypothetical protein